MIAFRTYYLIHWNLKLQSLNSKASDCKLIIKFRVMLQVLLKINQTPIATRWNVYCLTLERPLLGLVFSLIILQLWFNIWDVIHCSIYTIMIINLLCIERYLVNAFWIKYHQIHNVLYNLEGLSSPSRTNSKLYYMLKSSNHCQCISMWKR